MDHSLSPSWLGIRLGRDPQALERLGKAGQILGVRRGGGYAYPAWLRDGNVGHVLGVVRAQAA